MSSPDSQWKMLQAGEYVLGTLDSDSVAEVNAQMNTDAEMRDLVVDWQEKLQPLAATNDEIMPPPAVWRRINDQLGFNTMRSGVMRFDPERRAKRQRSRRQLVTWQWVGSMAIAASTLLAVALWQTQQSRQPTSTFDVVSIVSDAQNNPLWVINASLQQQTVQVTALSPPALNDDQDHQLWMVKPDNEGVSSLGLLPRDANVTVINRVQGLREDAIAFAVSLEPLGGSPEPVPTGPVLYQAVLNTVQTPGNSGR